MKKAKHRTSNIEHRTPNDGEFGAWVLREVNPNEKKYDLEERMLEFASANHIAGQILRSGTSPYAVRGEAESAESREDFIHKTKVCLKELRETLRWARLIHRKRWAHEGPTLIFTLSEAEELIRIFMSSVRTAKANALKIQAFKKTSPSKP